MPDWLSDAPLLVIAVLTGAAFVRGQAVYWLGRLASRGASALTDARPPDAAGSGWRDRVRRWLDSSAVDRARSVVRRWGLVAVPLAYLTVGLQSAILASAGALGVPWGRFSLAQLPGCLAWGTIYGTIGFAAWEAAIGAAFTSPLVVALIASVVLVAGGAWLSRRLRSR